MSSRRRRRSSDTAVGGGGGGGGFSPEQLSGLHVWLDASRETIYADNAEVLLARDFSGNLRNATAVTTFAPLYKVNIFNGKPVFRYDGSNDVLAFADIFSSLTAAEIFIVAKHLVAPASGLGSLWEMSGGAFSTYFPFTDGFGYDSATTTVRVENMVLGGATESPFIYNLTTQAGLITNRLNSTSLSVRNSNTLSWPVAPKVGHNAAGAMNFDVAEFLVYSTVLSASDRASVRNYLASKYAITAGVEYAVWNQLDKGAGIALSGGNLVDTASAQALVRATMGKSSGKWYWEVTATNGASNDSLYGVANASASLTTYLGGDVNGWGYHNVAGNKINTGSSVAYGSPWTTADKISVALDMDNGKIFFAKNGTWQNSGNPATGANPAYSGLTGTLYPANGYLVTPAVATTNFGASAFTYGVPSGFNAGMYA